MQTHCRNCQKPLPEEAKYCPFCSQKNTTGRVKVGTLIAEFLVNQINLDSKIFKSLRDLFVPGKLTAEYFKGRHKRYVHPIQLFFVLGVIMFGALAFSLKDELGDEEQITITGVNPEKMSAEYARSDLLEEMDTLIDRIKTLYPANNAGVALDSLHRAMWKLGKKHKADSLNLPILVGRLPRNQAGQPIRSISEKDFITHSPQELIEKYQVTGVYDQMQFRQLLRITKDGKGYLSFLLGQSIWILMLTIPLVALFMKLLYIRRSRYYVEHLVFFFHFHAFAFLVLVIIFLGASFLSGWLTGLLIFTIFAYLFMAMKRYYQQGLLKTALKFWMVILSYIFATSIGGTLVFLFTLFIF